MNKEFGGGKGELHIMHVAAINDHGADIDATQAGIPACAYCHMQDRAYDYRSRAVCYNCHLSGHQPLNADGKPHFWPIPD